MPVYLGTISYSDYLFQEAVLGSLYGLMAIDPTLFVLAVLVTVIAVASAVHHWVEWPFIALGQRLATTRAATA